MPQRTIDLTGLKVGKLTVINFAGFKDRRSNPNRALATWNCQCDCGTNKIISAAQLLNKTKPTLSCGCLNKSINITHKLSKSAEYISYRNMLARCYNIKHISYKNYGGRGIIVCQRWLDSVENFVEDMGEKPFSTSTIARLDTNLNYEPNNCIWLERSLQNRNTRRVLINTNIAESIRQLKEDGLTIGECYTHLLTYSHR